MDISINVHNMDLTPRLQEYVERKAGRLDRYMPHLNGVQVDLTSQNSRSATDRQIAQITVRDDRGTILRAEERHSDVFAAIDAVVDKLYRQIKRYRGKQIRNRRNGMEEVALVEIPEEMDVEGEDEEETAEGSIVRRKRFLLRPMPADEAIEQMELLGHDFYVFYNTEEQGINVLYRRHEGDYGLIQPVMD
jgi:putative sigma-54 modulation protein